MHKCTYNQQMENDFSQGKRGAVIPLPPGKERITIRLDADILDWFRQQATDQGGGNYQTMINQALREYVVERHKAPLEELVRRVMREELGQYKTDDTNRRSGIKRIKSHSCRKHTSEKPQHHGASNLLESAVSPGKRSSHR